MSQMFHMCLLARMNGSTVILNLLSTTTKRFGNLLIEREWTCILESCLSILEPCWLEKAVPPKTLKVWFTKTYCWWKKSCTTWDVKDPVKNGINYQPQLVQDLSHQQYQPFLRVKLSDSKTWDVRHQKRCTSRWRTARAVVCRRTAVQVLWDRAAGGDCNLAVTFIGPHCLWYCWAKTRQLHVSCRIL